MYFVTTVFLVSSVLSMLAINLSGTELQTTVLGGMALGTALTGTFFGLMNKAVQRDSRSTRQIRPE